MYNQPKRHSKLFENVSNDSIRHLTPFE